MMMGMNDLQPDIVWDVLMDAINDNAHRAFIRETLTKLTNDSQFAFLQKRIHETNVVAMTAVLKQAEARGEVKVDAVPLRVMTLPFDLVRHELLLTGRPVTHEAIIEIVDEIVLPLLTRYKPA